MCRKFVIIRHLDHSTVEREGSKEKLETKGFQWNMKECNNLRLGYFT